jgi:hypothetical protein
MTPPSRFPRPTVAWSLAILAPAFVFVLTGFDRNYQTDFWHHLNRGRAMVAEGRLIDEDRFTYTVAGRPFRDANWLTQLLYYALYREGGLPLVQFVNSLVLAATVAGLVYLCWRTSGSLRVAGLLAVFPCSGLWQVLIIRPQTFSLLLFVALYVVLDAAGRRRWLLLVPPALLALWANLHGGFPIGLVLIGAFFAGALWEAVFRDGRRFYREPQALALGLCLTASFLATFINPYGWTVYQYVGTTSATASAREIQEWLPPGFTLFMSKLWAASVLLVLVAFALPGRRPTARDVFLVLCFLPPSFGALRMVAWWWLASTPVVAAQVAASLPAAWVRPAEPERPSLTSALLFGVILLACVASVPQLERFKPLVGLPPRVHQTEADLEAVADHVRNTGGGSLRVFSRLEWGEYLGWSLAPSGYAVFMDGRIEIFPDDVWERYVTVTHGRPGWQKILDDYHVDWLVVDAQDDEEAPLLEAARHSGAWQEWPETSGHVVLFRRKSGQSVREAARGLAFSGQPSNPEPLSEQTPDRASSLRRARQTR